MFFKISITLASVLLALSSTAFSGQINYHGTEYVILPQGRLYLVTPLTYRTTLERSSELPAPNCDDFEAKIQRLESIRRHCLQSNRTDGRSSICEAYATAVQNLRFDSRFVGSPNPDSIQYWKLIPQDPERLTPTEVLELRRKAATELRLALHRVRAPQTTTFPQTVPSQIRFQSLEGAWEKKIAQATGSYDPLGTPLVYDAERNAFVTRGVDLACDFLKGQAMIIYQQEALLIHALPTTAEIQDNELWHLYRNLKATEFLPEETFVQRAVKTGVVLASGLQSHLSTLSSDADRIKIVSGIFEDFHHEQTPQEPISLKNFETEEAFYRELYPNSTALRAAHLIATMPPQSGR